MVSTATRQDAEEAARDLAVLAEAHRLLVLRHLRRGPRSAGFLAEAIGMSPSLASHHLAVLIEAGLVTRQHKGNYVCYATDHSRLRALYDRLGRLAGATGVAAATGGGVDPC
ncbi:MAG: ArsR/SmtB family transcription factor [Mycobacteriales bacterium]